MVTAECTHHALRQCAHFRVVAEARIQKEQDQISVYFVRSLISAILLPSAICGCQNIANVVVGGKHNQVAMISLAASGETNRETNHHPSNMKIF